MSIQLEGKTGADHNNNNNNSAMISVQVTPKATTTTTTETVVDVGAIELDPVNHLSRHETLFSTFNTHGSEWKHYSGFAAKLTAASLLTLGFSLGFMLVPGTDPAVFFFVKLLLVTLIYAYYTMFSYDALIKQELARLHSEQQFLPHWLQICVAFLYAITVVTVYSQFLLDYFDPWQYLLVFAGTHTVVFLALSVFVAVKKQLPFIASLAAGAALFIPLLQLAYSMWFGSAFFTTNSAWVQMCMCMGYPFGIGAIKKVQGMLLHVGFEPVVETVVGSEALSLFLAGVPYRIIFLAFQGYLALFLVLTVELCFKLSVYPVLLRTEMKYEITGVLDCLSCSNSSSAVEPEHQQRHDAASHEDTSSSNHDNSNHDNNNNDTVPLLDEAEMQSLKVVAFCHTLAGKFFLHSVVDALAIFGLGLAVVSLQANGALFPDFNTTLTFYGIGLVAEILIMFLVPLSVRKFTPGEIGKEFQPLRFGKSVFDDQIKNPFVFLSFLGFAFMASFIFLDPSNAPYHPG